MGKAKVSKDKRSPSSASSNRDRRREGMNKENVAPAATKSGRKVKSPQEDCYDYPAQIHSANRCGGWFGAYFSGANTVLVDPNGKKPARRIITPKKVGKNKTKSSPQHTIFSLTPTGGHGATPGGTEYTRSMIFSKKRKGIKKVKRAFYVEDMGSDEFSRLFAEKINGVRPPKRDFSEQVIKDGRHEESYSLSRGVKPSVTPRGKPSEHFGGANAQYFGLRDNKGKPEAFQFLHAQAVAHGGKGIAYPGTAAMNGMDIVVDQLLNFVVQQVAIGGVDVTAAQTIKNYVVGKSTRTMGFTDKEGQLSSITFQSTGEQFPTKAMLGYFSAYGDRESLVSALSSVDSILTPGKTTPPSAASNNSVRALSTASPCRFFSPGKTGSPHVCNLTNAFSEVQSPQKNI